ncbi:hypothetical protein [Cardiobacterium hominis]|nr:hypothetical protein [Cardiobacterium hominis]
MAAKNYRKDGINRILLATDGDFNVSISKTASGALRRARRIAAAD